MSIPLPPLPRLFASDKLQHATETAILRARDLEIARVVLEEAVKACGHLAQADAVASIIRALEFHHAE